MKKAKLNSKLAIAGALVSGLLMIVLVVGFTADKFADSNTNAIEVQSTDNALAYVVYDGKCGDDKNADKKAKDAEKAQKKEESKSAKMVVMLIRKKTMERQKVKKKKVTLNLMNRKKQNAAKVNAAKANVVVIKPKKRKVNAEKVNVGCNLLHDIMKGCQFWQPFFCYSF